MVYDLSKYDHDYDDAVPPEGGSRVKDGDYQAEVKVCRIESSTFNRDGQNIYWELRILSGDYVGRDIKKWSAIERDRMPYIKKELETCGLNLARFSELPNRLRELIGVRLQVTVKSKAKKSGTGTYTNVYFNELLKGKSGQSTGEMTDGGVKPSYPKYDDVPF